MLDIGRTIGGLAILKVPMMNSEDAQEILDSAREHLKAQEESIAALQCALDKANEKLAYISGDETYHYDCESGRRQLNDWWEAHLAMEKGPESKRPSVEAGEEQWFSFDNCPPIEKLIVQTNRVGECRIEIDPRDGLVTYSSDGTGIRTCSTNDVKRIKVTRGDLEVFIHFVLGADAHKEQSPIRGREVKRSG